MLNRVFAALFLVFCLSQQGLNAQDSSFKNIVEKYPNRAIALIESLDLDRPGLTDAQVAFDRGETDRALELIIGYFRGKPFPELLKPTLPPARKDIVELAEDATNDIFTIQSRTFTQPRLEHGGLAWDDLGPNEDKEWAWMMNRHQHFFFLITAYRYNKKPVYLQTVNEHIIDWIKSHPVPDRLSFSTSWRALEAARRVTGAWLALYGYAKENPAISNEAIFLLLSSIPEHARLLTEHHSFWGGNHIVTEKMAISVCAIVWPEFKASSHWLKLALDVLNEELIAQTYPDGSFKELANHYQKIVAQSFLKIITLLEENDTLPEPEGFRVRVKKMWDYMAFVSRPSGFGPLNNDSTLEDNFHHLEVANAVFGDPEWTHIITNAANGLAPEQPPSRYFPWAGHAILRNGWDANAHWSFFDVGPNGSAHQHFDRLHLSISLGQDDVLVDTGRYIYIPGKFRHYFRGGEGHNIVRVNELDSVRAPNTVSKPMEVDWSSEESYDRFQAEVRFAPNKASGSGAKHNRTVIYVRDRGWLIVDQLIGFGPKKYDTIWNFHPDCLVTQKGNSLKILTGSEKMASLILLNHTQGDWSLARGQTEPIVRGWYSWAYNERRATTNVHFTTRINHPHTNIWWLAEDGDALPKLENESGNDWQVWIETPTKRLQVFNSGRSVLVKPSTKHGLTLHTE